MNDETFTTRTSTFRLRDDGITHGIVLPDVLEHLEDAQNNVAMVAKLNNGKPALVLSDIRAGLGVDRDARAYYSGKEAVPTTRAVALLVGSRFTQTMANLFIRVNNPLVPTRLFTSEEEALAWLKTFAS